MNKYRSRYEANIAKGLKSKGIKFEYETVKINYYLKKRGKCQNCDNVKSIFVHKTYTPDFIMGSMIVEAKGRFTSVDRTKMAQVVKENPNLDIRMLFMRDQWCNKSKSKKYSDWCNAHNIKFAFGISLPTEWLKELR
jgi:hypothetical protein